LYGHFCQNYYYYYYYYHYYHYYYYFYYYHYYYYCLLHLSFHLVAVVLKLVQTKQIRINIHK